LQQSAHDPQLRRCVFGDLRSIIDVSLLVDAVQ